MKKFISLVVATLAATATLQAEAPYYHFDAPGDNGKGFYVGLQGGCNLTQDTANDTVNGIKITSKSDVGGFGGLKLGYVVSTPIDWLRPAVEFDGFYNQFSQPVTARFHGVKVSDADLKVDSGAFMANGILRIAVGSFQPYIGAGVGVYTDQETTNMDSSFRIVDGYFVNINGGEYTQNRTNFAWQLIGGVDYYITPTVSIFTEYKFLNYMDGGDRLGQQLVGGGFRFHF
jgi:opacity protein-like surface antigen